MKNNLSNLNDYLFEQLDRLTNDDFVGEKLREEIARVEAVVDVSAKIIENANLQVNVCKMAYDAGVDVKMPQLLLSD